MRGIVMGSAVMSFRRAGASRSQLGTICGSRDPNRVPMGILKKVVAANMTANMTAGPGPNRVDSTYGVRDGHSG